MKKHLVNRQYWFRVLKYFAFFLPLYFIIQFIGEDKADFWTFSHLSSSIGTAFLMAIVFSYSFHSGKQNTGDDESIAPTKPTWKEFWGVYVILAAVSLALISVLLVIGWFTMQLIAAFQTPFWHVFAKALLSTIIMCFLINSVFFLNSYWQYNHWKKTNGLRQS